MEGTYDVSDLIFRRNCSKYFDQKTDVGDIDLQTKKENVLPEIDEAKPRKPTDMEDLRFPEMVVAVDATPTRGGGLLRLPGMEKTIFYYSVNWTDHFETSESTKFEMINCALALELFEPYLKAYRPRYVNFSLKTDSNFYLSRKGLKDPHDFSFLGKLLQSLRSLDGNLFTVIKLYKDPDILNADYLSRSEITVGLKYTYQHENTGDQYALVNLSSMAEHYALSKLERFVPEKYLKKMLQ